MDLVKLSYNVASSSLGWGLLNQSKERFIHIRMLDRSFSNFKIADRRSEQDIKSEQDFVFKNTVRKYLDQIAKIYSHSLLAIVQEKNREYGNADVFLFAEFSSALRKKYAEGVEIDEDSVSVSEFPIPELIPVLEALSLKDDDLRSVASRLPLVDGKRILKDEDLPDFLIPFRHNLDVESAEGILGLGRECPLFTIDSSQISRAIFSQAKGENVAKLNDALQQTITRLVSRVPRHIVENTHDLFSPSTSTSIKEGIDQNQVIDSLVKHLKTRRRVGIEFDSEDLYNVIKYADGCKKFWEECKDYSRKNGGESKGDDLGFKSFCDSYYPAVSKLLEDGRNADVPLFALPEFMDALREYEDNLDESERDIPSNEFIENNIKSIFRSYSSIPYLSGISDDVKSIKAITELFKTRVSPGGFSNDFLNFAKSVPDSTFVESGSVIKKQVGKTKSLLIPRPPKSDDTKGISLSFFLPSSSTIGEKLLEKSGLDVSKESKEEDKSKIALLNEYKRNVYAILSSVYDFSKKDGTKADIKTAKSSLREVVEGLLDDEVVSNVLKYSLYSHKLRELVGPSLDKISTYETLANRYNQVKSTINQMGHEWIVDADSILAISKYVHGDSSTNESIKKEVETQLKSANLKLESNFRTLGSFESGNKTNERVVHLSFDKKSDYDKYLENVGATFKKVISDLDTDPGSVLEFLSNLGIYIEDSITKKSGNWVRRLEESGSLKERRDKVRVPTSARQFILQDLSAEFLHTLMNNERITRQTLDLGVEKSVSERIADNFVRSFISLVLKMCMDIAGDELDSAKDSYGYILKDLNEVRKLSQGDKIINNIKETWSSQGLPGVVLDKILKSENVIEDDSYLETVRDNQEKIGRALKSSITKINKNDSYLYGTSLNEAELEQVKKSIKDIVTSPSVDVGGTRKVIKDSLVLRRKAISDALSSKITNNEDGDKHTLSLDETEEIIRPFIMASLGKIFSDEFKVLPSSQNVTDLVTKTLTENEENIRKYISECSRFSNSVERIGLSDLENKFLKDVSDKSISSLKDLVNSLPKKSRIYELFLDFKERIQKEQSEKRHGKEFRHLDLDSVEEEALEELQKFLKSADRNEDHKPRHMSGDVSIDDEEGGGHNFWDTINEDNPAFKGDKESESSKEFLGMSGLFDLFKETDRIEEKKILSDIKRVIEIIRQDKNYIDPSTEEQLKDKKRIDSFLTWLGGSTRTLKSLEHEGLVNVHKYLEGNTLVGKNLSRLKELLYQYFVLNDVDNKLADTESSDYTKMMDLATYASGDLDSNVSAKSNSILESLVKTSSLDTEKSRLNLARQSVSNIVKARINRILRQNMDNEQLDDSTEMLHHVFRIGSLVKCFENAYDSIKEGQSRVFSGVLESLSKSVPGRIQTKNWDKLNDQQRALYLNVLAAIESRGEPLEKDDVSWDVLNELYKNLQVLYVSYLDSSDKSGRLGYKTPRNYRRVNYIERLLHKLNKYLQSTKPESSNISDYDAPSNELIFQSDLYKSDLSKIQSDLMLVVAAFAQEMDTRQISPKYKDLYNNSLTFIKKKYDRIIKELDLINVDDIDNLIKEVGSNMSMEKDIILPQFSANNDVLNSIKNAVLTTNGWKEEWSEDAAINQKTLVALVGLEANDRKLNAVKEIYMKINPEQKFPQWRVNPMDSTSDAVNLPGKLLNPINLGALDYVLEYYLKLHDDGELDSTSARKFIQDYKQQMNELRASNGPVHVKSLLEWTGHVGIGQELRDGLNKENMVLVRKMPVDEPSMLKAAQEMFSE